MDPGLKDFYFLSDFLNRSAYEPSGQRAGKIADMVAERTEPYPMVTGIIVRRGRTQKGLYLPWEKTFSRSRPSFPARISFISGR